MFGKRKKQAESTEAPETTDDVATSDVDTDSGPYDIEDAAELLEKQSEGRLDLGSVVVPMPAGGQLQVEMSPDGSPQGVHLVTDHGRITVAAYAAPKSPGQWREVIGELTTALRADNATAVAIETGPWGRELVASNPAADLRFIGVDGYRWMIRLVATGPVGSAAEGSPLVEAARAVLRETVVRRGTDPHPVRTPLPIALPKELADQLVAAHQQQLAAQQAAEAAAATPVQPQAAPPPVRKARRGAEGSAMQQLGK